MRREIFAVCLLFIAGLVFSVAWQNRKPDAVTAELYAPPPVAAPQAAPDLSAMRSARR